MIDCPHRHRDECRLAGALAQLPAPTTDRACAECAKCREPRANNPLVVSLAFAALRKHSPAAADVFMSKHAHILSGANLPPKPRPTLPAQAWSLARAVAEFVWDGAKTVDPHTYQTRLALCDACPHRDGSRCNGCGCYVSWKASMPNQECPAALWPPLNSEI